MQAPLAEHEGFTGDCFCSSSIQKSGVSLSQYNILRYSVLDIFFFNKLPSPCLKKVQTRGEGLISP